MDCAQQPAKKAKEEKPSRPPTHTQRAAIFFFRYGEKMQAAFKSADFFFLSSKPNTGRHLVGWAVAELQWIAIGNARERERQKNQKHYC